MSGGPQGGGADPAVTAAATAATADPSTDGKENASAAALLRERVVRQVLSSDVLNSVKVSACTTRNCGHCLWRRCSTCPHRLLPRLPASVCLPGFPCPPLAGHLSGTFSIPTCAPLCVPGAPTCTAVCRTQGARRRQQHPHWRWCMAACIAGDPPQPFAAAAHPQLPGL